jgi:hypothetical protein
VRDPAAKPRIIETVKGPSCPWPETQEDRFIRERLAGVPAGVPGNPSKHYIETYLHALVELVRSDIPLDPDTRQLIAGALEEYYFPGKRARQEKRRAETFSFLQVVDGMKNFLRHNKKKPLSALDAEAVIAERMYGISVDALRQQITRARQLLRKR